MKAFATCARLGALLITLTAPRLFAAPHFAVAPDWPALPPEHVLGLCAGVGVDSHQRVFVFHRCGRTWTTPFPTDPIIEPTVSIIDGTTGRLLGSWGAGMFVMPHGLTIDHEDNVWLTDVALQQVFKFTPDGRLLLTLGERCVSGADRAHFNLPSDVAVLTDGSFFVSDGYRNSRVVKFSADGQFQAEWGTRGTAPGQFHLPHGIAADAAGRVYVYDRTNSRVQVFEPGGKFLAEWKGPQIGRPYGVSVSRDGTVFLVDGSGGKAVALDRDGHVLDTFGAPGQGPGEFQTGHDIAVAPDGAVYVAESGGKRVQKFVASSSRP